MNNQLAQIAADVLHHFPLESPRVIGPIDAATMNDNLLVADQDGKRYVLRNYRRNRDEARVGFQLRFQQHLFVNGFPTSQVVPAVSGKLRIVHDGIPWSLFTYVEGSEFDFSHIKQAFEAGNGSPSCISLVRDSRRRKLKSQTVFP